MDVIVKWRDGTENCVSIKDIKCMRKGDSMRVGSAVKMLFERKWYYGVIIMTEKDLPKKQRKESLLGDEGSTDADYIAGNEQLPFTAINADDKYDESSCVQKNISTSIRRASFSSDVTICVDDTTDAYNNSTIMQIPDNLTVQQDSILSDQTDCSESILPRIIDDERRPRNEECAGEQTIVRDEPHTDYPIVTRNVETEYRVQSCEVNECHEEVFSSCVRCEILLCWHHFENDSVCDDHLQPLRILLSSNDNSRFCDQRTLPEDFAVEGAPRETDRRETAINKRKTNKENKDFGKEYSTQVSKQVIPERKLGPICNTTNCKRIHRECYLFSENNRQEIFKSYWGLGSLSTQRDFIARHVEQECTKQKTAGPESRRQNTVFYYLYLNGEKTKVCRTFFLNTLGIGETIVKTVLKKLLPTGILEKDMRGGRKPSSIEKDDRAKAIVEEHIKRFPKVESHYCREKSTREYLNSELTIRKMHSMLVEDLRDEPKPSLSLYRKIFKSKNLSFHRPKKDQCSLCSTYRQGNEETKRNLQEKYTTHLEQKQSFRNTRSERKGEAQTNTLSTVCATFDMQQVIHLPRSNESALFYLRRLSVLNFTIYDMVSHECYCNTWHEGLSKRGASEIATALYLFLKNFDEKGVKKVFSFADGCSGQNKNSIVASALLYFINNSVSIEEIILSISAPCHGQNEGDSAHSAIGYAIKKSGDIFVPSQLSPIIKLARRRQPYKVVALNYSDFMDFKKLSQDLRVLSIRKDNEGETVDWRNMAELSFQKTNGDKIFF